MGQSALIINELDVYYQAIDEHIRYWHHKKACIATEMIQIQDSREKIIENAWTLAAIKLETQRAAQCLSSKH